VSGGRSAPSCVASLPALAAAISNARAAGALVIYSVHPAPDTNILLDVAPVPDDPVFVAAPGGDKFFNSSLDDYLKQGGITTLVITGFSSNVGVLYTSGGALLRGYTVVVPEDGIGATTDLA